MLLAQEFAGIPIELPGWTQVAAYSLLGLLALLIGVLIWRGLQKRKLVTQNGEIHAKVNLILLMLRNWQENGELTEDVSRLENEHHAVDPERTPINNALSSGSYAPQSVTFGSMPDPASFRVSDRDDDTNDYGRLIK